MNLRVELEGGSIPALGASHINPLDRTQTPGSANSSDFIRTIESCMHCTGRHKAVYCRVRSMYISYQGTSTVKERQTPELLIQRGSRGEMGDFQGMN